MINDVTTVKSTRSQHLPTRFSLCCRAHHLSCLLANLRSPALPGKPGASSPNHPQQTLASAPGSEQSDKPVKLYTSRILPQLFPAVASHVSSNLTSPEPAATGANTPSSLPLCGRNLSASGDSIPSLSAHPQACGKELHASACLDTPAGSELVLGSSSRPKITLALELFGWKG
jgi:hypothetical protein